jgi:chloramphenicol-sensitive protein RarD
VTTETTETAKKQRQTGYFLAFAAYTTWGLIPIYWKLLPGVSAWEILCYRLIWTVGLMALILLLRPSWGLTFLRETRAILRAPKTILRLSVSSALVTVHWFVFILAISQERIAETSLGYFITPLVTFLLAICFLRERLNRNGILACTLALSGVIIITLDAGALPWVSLFLAVSFALYGLVKRGMPQQSYTTLTLETLLLLPVALIYVTFFSPVGFHGYTLNVNLLLIGAGVVTGVPFLFFTEANRRISYVAIGFFQYLEPSISFGLALLVYHEPFTSLKLCGFALIWLGIACYLRPVKRSP